jgi:hypothetical protein
MLQSTKFRLTAVLSMAFAFGLAAVAWTVSAQPKTTNADCPCHHGALGAGPGRGAGHRDDMMTIHALFADRSIRRTVKEVPGGVETTTESDTLEGAATIQKHVAAMYARLTKGTPIHARDPLFAELFAHADKVVMLLENIPEGVKVRETSTDPYVTKLIRAHAAVVTRFIENGRREMHVDHAVPEH